MAQLRQPARHVDPRRDPTLKRPPKRAACSRMPISSPNGSISWNPLRGSNRRSLDRAEASRSTPLPWSSISLVDRSRLLSPRVWRLLSRLLSQTARGAETQWAQRWPLAHRAGAGERDRMLLCLLPARAESHMLATRLAIANSSSSSVARQLPPW
jgi:hypothetical protein